MTARTRRSTAPRPRGAKPPAGGNPGGAEALERLLARVKFDERGLVPVIAQEEDGTVLMLAWANREALAASVEGGRATYWSRSRASLWRKGDTSGHVQALRAVALDCDGDAVLYVVRQTGPACHLETRSCFSERQEIPWQTSASSRASGRRSSPAGPTKARPRATPGRSSRTPPRRAGR